VATGKYEDLVKAGFGLRRVTSYTFRSGFGSRGTSVLGRIDEACAGDEERN
jgi:hypothetical protein